MKRSEINALVADSIEFIEAMHSRVPPWVRWDLDKWKEHRKDVAGIIDSMLGWDITDFGSGDFSARGLIMLTLRNGNLAKEVEHPKMYAEKLLITRENQVTPRHFHWSKMEDIINRGGGNLIVHVWGSTDSGELSTEDVVVSVDGIPRTVEAGGTVTLPPGESITLTPGMYHKFYGEPGTGKILLGEVSSVNNDTNDNRFYELLPRFPEIDPDEPPKYPLITEYKQLLW